MPVQKPMRKKETRPQGKKIIPVNGREAALQVLLQVWYEKTMLQKAGEIITTLTVFAGIAVTIFKLKKRKTVLNSQKIGF